MILSIYVLSLIFVFCASAAIKMTKRIPIIRNSMRSTQETFTVIKKEKRSIAEMVNASTPSIVCYTKSSWTGIYFVTFPNSQSETPRRFLELYFDRPMLIRSFFTRKCANESREPNAYLLQHVENPVVNSNTWFYGKNNLHEIVDETCTRDAKNKNSCICSTASRIALHMIEAIENANTDNVQSSIFILDNEKILSLPYMIRFMAEFLQRFGDSIGEKDIDIERIESILRVMQERYMLGEDVKNIPQSQKDTASRCFLEQWLIYKTRELAQSLFPEVNFDVSALRVSMPTQSSLNPDVNVLIPTKNPLRLEFCLASLYNKADLTFGHVFFHFGVDFGDTKTIDEIDKVCKKLTLFCVVHEVFSRDSDVSAIVNHMFMSIEQSSYFFRFNDDSEMLTKRWNVMAINALRQPPVDVGIAKITDLGNPTLQTHSFVSSVHKEIFGCYFPVHFKNIYEDNWITDVYSGPLTKTCFVKLKHHAIGSRYSALHVPHDVLKPIVQQGKTKIARFLD